MNITRREFTKALGSLGAAGILGIGSSSVGEQQEPGLQAPDRTGFAKQRRLGKTDLVFSQVGFGAQHTRDSDLIRYALDQGVNHIETAWAYGFGRPGGSCECIGKAIAGQRDSVQLAVAYQAEPSSKSKAWLPNQFEQTLRDLKTDHIDLFLWHHPGGGSINNSQLTLKQSQDLITAGERVDLMLKWKAEGKIRWCGVTTHSEQPEWLKFVAESDWYNVAVVAFNYNSPKAILEAMEKYSHAGLGLIAMKTQSPNYADGEAAIGAAPDHRRALSWVLSKHYVTAAIPGMTTRGQVDLNLEIMRSEVVR